MTYCISLFVHTINGQLQACRPFKPLSLNFEKSKTGGVFFLKTATAGSSNPVGQI